MPHKILNEDWSDYDNRKKVHTDARYFACTESWEVDYLARKIMKVSGYCEAGIRNVITNCCRTVGSPHPRPAFVECVMKRLRG